MPRNLEVPTYLLCGLSHKMMQRPVLIQSGLTFERSVIEDYFKEKEKERDQARDDSSFDEASFFRCPITQLRVDPSVMIENSRIREATWDFVEKNPWAYNFDKRESLRAEKLEFSLTKLAKTLSH